MDRRAFTIELRPGVGFGCEMTYVLRRVFGLIRAFPMSTGQKRAGSLVA
jgi:hypothetical protein